MVAKLGDRAEGPGCERIIRALDSVAHIRRSQVRATIVVPILQESDVYAFYFDSSRCSGPLI
jgi:hypothetical protein